tara:strand:- start:888 stop:1235 length:348 start_codon:yes stop_codon:yes gene_type:complete
MTDAEKIAALRNNLDNLDAKGRDFANSLLGWWDRRGRLSTKQWYWVDKLAGIANQKKNSKKEETPKNTPDPRFEAMLAAFRSANDGQRKRVMRAIHPDLWGGAEWATVLFQAANE